MSSERMYAAHSPLNIFFWGVHPHSHPSRTHTPKCPKGAFRGVGARGVWVRVWGCGCVGLPPFIQIPLCTSVRFQRRVLCLYKREWLHFYLIYLYIRINRAQCVTFCTLCYSNEGVRWLCSLSTRCISKLVIIITLIRVIV